MTHDDPRDHDPPPPVHYGRARLSPMRRASKFASGVVGAWFFVFLATLFAWGAGYDRGLPWWAIPMVGVVTVACAALALRIRKTKPEVSAGIWTGVGIGLLNAGLCLAAV